MVIGSRHRPLYNKLYSCFVSKQAYFLPVRFFEIRASFINNNCHLYGQNMFVICSFLLHFMILKCLILYLNRISLAISIEERFGLWHRTTVSKKPAWSSERKLVQEEVQGRHFFGAEWGPSAGSYKSGAPVRRRH